MEFKHFSHHHYLTFQTLQNGPEINCSGCKTLVTGGAIYTCWQCSFFLHEQCFKAGRSLDHHSHPSHPLTLIPYPTYPSATFICNSCNQTGTGFYFSCSHCEFDLHVHCAYYNPHNTQTTPPNPTFPSSQFPFPPPIPTLHESPFPGLTNPNPWNPIPPTYDPYPPSHSFPNETPSFNPQFPYNPHNNPHVPAPYPHQNPSHGPNQTPSSFNSPMDPHHSAVHQPPFQNVHNVQHPPPPFTPVSSFSAHTGPETATHGPNPQHPKPSPTPSNFNAPMTPHQHVVHQPVQNVPNPQNQEPYEPVPNRPSTETQSNTNKPVSVSGDQSHQKLNGVKHFSHQHALLFSNIKQEDGIICSGCEHKVSGSAYACTVSNCNFNLHNSCFGLPRTLNHKSHPKHPLTLLSTPPYDNEYKQYTCNGCLEDGGAFVYHCSTCDYDLHVDCAFLPETVERDDHKHVLSLLYDFPFKKTKEDDPDLIFTCDVCRTTVDQRCWFYYCRDCDFGTHLGCIATAQIPQKEEPSEAVSELAAMLETQAQLQRLQLEMQMATQTAQLIASMGQSLSNLAG